ncbi:MAG: alpha/beta hydrolase [Bacilli bacterium]|nr:alpha/beta hydrolase [Bacilli bacterium]
MKKKIKNIDINYVRYGNNQNKTIVLLHGWGQNIDMMRPIGDNLQDAFDIVIIDLPGYGLSDEPDYVWTIYDYADAMAELLNSLKIKNPIMIGHSFGGKIALTYASKYGAQKLVLFGSPYRPEIQKLSLKTKILKKIAKIKILSPLVEMAKKHIGSTDYKNASSMMRKILVETVNLDITEDVKKIKCSTLLIWGEKDTAVPLERAYELEKLINDAGVVVYDECTHYAYLERLNQTIHVLNSFLK